MLRLAVSARALFNMEDGHDIFLKDGQDAFDEYMRKNERKPLRHGPAFNLVTKLLSLNSEGLTDRVEVILVSRNSPEAGVRVFNSVKHHGLNINRAAFVRGGTRFGLVSAFKAHLFLSRHPEEVREALDNGIAAATLEPHALVPDSKDNTVHIAFDGDAVLFDDSAEAVNHKYGLQAFIASEIKNAKKPLGGGPFRPVLEELAKIKEEVGDRLRFSLVTARGFTCSERVSRTLRSWGVKLDGTVFCDGSAKGPVLNEMEVDMFLDDGLRNIASASQYVASGHVPSGISNSGKPKADAKSDSKADPKASAKSDVKIDSRAAAKQAAEEAELENAIAAVGLKP